MKQLNRTKSMRHAGLLFTILAAFVFLVAACSPAANGVTPEVTVAPTSPSPVGTSIAATPTGSALPSTGGNATAVPEETYTADILVRDDALVPATMTVPQGAVVTWRNGGTQAHTITDQSGAFDSGSIAPGKTYQFVFSQLGTFSYSLDNNAASGQIIVTEAPTPAPTEAP